MVGGSMRRATWSPQFVLVVWVVLLVVTTRPALAATGIGLAWDHCQGEAGAMQNKAFACNTNAGVDIAYATATLAAPIASVDGFDLVLSIVSTATVPDWWQFVLPTGCRTGSMSAPQLADPDASVCEDWSHGVGSGTFSGIDILKLCVGPAPQANKVGMTAGAFTPIEEPQDLVEGQEYFLFSLRMTHMKTVGTGACGGCEAPVCITFCGGRIHSTLDGFHVLDGTPSIPGGNVITWQGGSPSCLGATPARRATWGSVKALYR